jgi:hypothetical protein
VRGVYTVSFATTTITNANGDVDLFELDAAADEPVELVAIFIGNKSEVGDAQEEELAWSIRRFSGGTFTSSNGTSATPRATTPGDEAASFTAETVGTTVASTSGTEITVHQDTFNVRTGLQLIIPPEMRIQLDGAAQSAMVIRLDTAVADDTDLRGTIYVKQLL